MIDIKPFKAYRPDREYVEQVVALPYDVVNEKEARAIGENNPYSFLYVDKPEVFCKEKEENIYEVAGQFLEELISKGILIQEDTPCFYIYGLESEYGGQYGIVGCLSCKDYENGKIKKHENTREDKERDRVLHIAGCSAHTGPIFLACKEENQLESFISTYRREYEPLFDFIHEGVRQVVYRIDTQHALGQVTACFNQMEALYVADGHHRLAAATAYARMRRQNARDESSVSCETEEYENFLGVVFPKSQLTIMDYNRVLQDESGLNKEKMIKEIEKNFEIKSMGTTAYRPTCIHKMGMCCKGNWYALCLKAYPGDASNPVATLDTTFLQNLILEPIFHIEDPRTDKRIDFVGGIKGIEELSRRTKQDMDIAFSLYPPTMDELIAVADAGMLMPPKSTWFEPKLRSGLFIHVF